MKYTKSSISLVIGYRPGSDLHVAESNVAILYQNDMYERNIFRNGVFESSLKNIVKWHDIYVIAQTVGI